MRGPTAQKCSFKTEHQHPSRGKPHLFLHLSVTSVVLNQVSQEQASVPLWLHTKLLYYITNYILCAYNVFPSFTCSVKTSWVKMYLMRPRLEARVITFMPRAALTNSMMALSCCTWKCIAMSNSMAPKEEDTPLALPKENVRKTCQITKSCSN